MRAVRIVAARWSATEVVTADELLKLSADGERALRLRFGIAAASATQTAAPFARAGHLELEVGPHTWPPPQL